MLWSIKVYHPAIRPYKIHNINKNIKNILFLQYVYLSNATGDTDIHDFHI